MSLLRIQSLLEHLSKIIRVPIRKYDQEFALVERYGEFNSNAESFEDDLVLLKRFVKETQSKFPIQIFEGDTVFSAVILNEKENQYYIIGMIKAITKIAKKKRKISTDIETVCEAAALIYEFFSDKKLSNYEILSFSYNELKSEKELEEYLSDHLFDYQEEGTLHNPYSQEVREQASIREGNRGKLILSFEESYSGRLAILSKDELRSMKNLGIVVLAISTRSAIEGGLHPEQAFLLSDSFILKVDEAKTQMEITKIVRNAELFFTELIADLKSYSTENPMIVRAKDLIFKNMHEKITVEQLAQHLNTTSSYLSKTFKKEMNCTIHEFIIREKLIMTESLLMYSDYSIEEIAHYYGFSSQSHFGSLFKKYYQTSPNKFRQKYGVKRGI